MEPSPPDLVAADFDDDGKIDLTVSCGGDFEAVNGSLVLVRGLGDGTGGFQPPRALGLEDDLIRHLFVGDADHDGQPDLGCATTSLAVPFRGLGDGSFVEAGRGRHGGGRVRVADFDRDGWPDLISASSQGYAVVLRNPLTPDLVRPSLFVRLDAPGKVAVTWPEIFPDWTLTESATLRPPWHPTTREVTANDSQLQVLIDPAAAPPSSYFPAPPP